MKEAAIARLLPVNNDFDAVFYMRPMPRLHNQTRGRRVRINGELVRSGLSEARYDERVCGEGVSCLENTVSHSSSVVASVSVAAETHLLDRYPASDSLYTELTK